MEQLVLIPTEVQSEDPVADILRTASTLGWQADLTCHKPRWYLPETFWHMRCYWHTTVIYQKIGREVFSMQRYPTACLYDITLTLERCSLALLARAS